MLQVNPTKLFWIWIVRNLHSLWSEICRTLRIQVGCTHARTTKNHYNALLWSQLVLGWVQRNSNFWSSDRRLTQPTIPPCFMQYPTFLHKSPTTCLTTIRNKWMQDELGPITVLETTGDPVTGGPPMLMSKAVYWKALSLFVDRQTSNDWNSSHHPWESVESDWEYNSLNRQRGYRKITSNTRFGLLERGRERREKEFSSMHQSGASF